MMKAYKVALGVLVAALSFGALAEGGGDRTFALM
ncbi:co-regulatory protein PtrA N-terminal domain-containing protein, partial [Klebsiella pneumoniae]